MEEGVSANRRAESRVSPPSPSRGHEILVSDVDTAWLRDPREWFANDPSARADVALSTDCLSREDERAPAAAGTCNSTPASCGRPTEPTEALMEQWRDALLTTDHKFEHDQDILNRLLREETDGRRPGFRPVSDDADADAARPTPPPARHR